MTGPVVITGGGTGGHVFPMQAVADALVATGLAPAEIRYVGSRRGQDARLLGDEFSLTLLPGRGVRRSLRPRALVANLGAVAGLLVAVARALVLVRRWRASVVVSVGGYASFAVSAAAWCWRVPLVLVEFDAVPGAAQRVFRRYAACRCRSLPSDDPRVVVTGTPLRPAVESLDRSRTARAAARAAAAPPFDSARTVVVVMTGSLGATRVNRAVRELAAAWSARRDVALVHVTGRRDYPDFSPAPATTGLDYRVVAFADMAELWAVADVGICRAGAVTVAELTALNVPSILVPLPGAPGDHQTMNAAAVVAAGGARLVPDAECDAATLARVLDEVMTPATLAAMAEGASTLARRGAATAIADVVRSTRRPR